MKLRDEAAVLSAVEDGRAAPEPGRILAINPYPAGAAVQS
jgi:hypothetical protein